MNDSLQNIFGDTIQVEVDSANARQLNFPFVFAPDSMPFKVLTIEEISTIDKSIIKERFLTKSSNKPALISPQPIIHQSNDWLVGILIFCFFVVSYLRIGNRRFFKNLMQGLISRPMFRQMIREGDLFSTGIMFPMSLVVLLIYSAFVFQLIAFLNPGSLVSSVSAFQLYIYLFAGILLLISLKTMFVKFAGILFKTSELADEYITNSFFFHIISTITILPVLLFSLFDKSSFLTYLAIILFGLLFIYRFLRAVFISLQMRKYSSYQNLLYLCTLEILPILIFIKVLN